jgi:hypothetical protein
MLVECKHYMMSECIIRIGARGWLGLKIFPSRTSLRPKKYSLFILKSSIFWDITPCSPLKVNRRFGGTRTLHFQGRRISQTSKSLLATCFHAGFFWLILRPWRWGATCSSETSVDFQRATRRYIPEYISLHNRRCENLKSYIYLFWLLHCIYHSYDVIQQDLTNSD